jgi:hypothetical protein
MNRDDTAGARVAPDSRISPATHSPIKESSVTALTPSKAQHGAAAQDRGSWSAANHATLAGRDTTQYWSSTGVWAGV